MSEVKRKLKAYLRPVKSIVRASAIDPVAPVELLRALLFGRIHVLPRSLTHFERIAKPAGGRTSRSEEAVQLAALMRSPYDGADVYVRWGKDHAATWTWPATALRHKGLGREAWIVPEEALQDIDQPVSLTRCVEGWALQVRDETGVILSSRWWPERPTEADLTQAHQGMGLSRSTAPVEISVPRVVSWPVTNWRLAATKAVREPPLFAASIAAMVALIPLFYMAGSLAAHTLAAARVANELASIEQEGQEFMEARDELARIGREATFFTEMFVQGHPVPAVADFLNVARRHEIVLERMRVEQSVFFVDFRAESEIDPAALVGDLEALATFEQVRIERGRSAAGWQVRAQISGG